MRGLYQLLKMTYLLWLLLSLATLHSCKTESYVTYLRGDIQSKLIINAPHGGGKKPSDFRDRTSGCFDSHYKKCTWNYTCGGETTQVNKKCSARTEADSYTKKISQKLANEITKLTGMKPHLIINELHRSKFDGNREIHEATFDERNAVKAYHDYHGTIAQVKNSITGRGLFLDIHGWKHPEEWIGLGYLVTRKRLNHNTTLAKYSSIKSLNSQLNPVSFDVILRQDNSLGRYLEEQDIATVPSPEHPSPGNVKYYGGGFNTRQYGSRYGGKLDAIQVEIPKRYRKNASFIDFSRDLAKAVVAFMNENYGGV